MTGIGEAVAAVRGAYALARSAKDITDKVKLDTAVIEVLDALGNAQSALLELQQQHFDLIKENRELKEKLKEEQRFEDYVLRETSPVGGSFILELRTNLVDDDTPPHAICPQCKEDKRLSPLRKTPTDYVCSKCSFVAPHTSWKRKSVRELGRELG
tara:strand:+ start:544 stop:1011 length:468 start_codon:yes stop_codon:yes gene_type:complete